MEENIIDNTIPGIVDNNTDFGLIPGSLLQEEIHFREEFPIDRARSLYRLCVELALLKEPFGTTSTVHFDYLKAKVTKNQFYRDAYGGFEPTEFHEIRKFNPVSISEEQEKDEINNIIAQFKKKHQTRKGHKAKREFIPPDGNNFIVSDGDKERPLNKKEQKEEIERARKIFEEADSLSRYDEGMYDVYHGYSNIELRTKEDYNFLRDGYEFEDFKLCFAFKLRQIEKDNVRLFFKYQLRANFQSNKEDFKDFVKGIIDGYNEPNFFPHYLMQPVNNFLGEEYLKIITPGEANKALKENNEVDTKELEPLEKPTHKQIVKALEFLLLNLKDFDFNENNFDLSNLLRFFHFITETPIPPKVKASQSHFYKVWRERRKTSKKQQLNDLEVILKIFLSLKMDSTSIVKSIKKEIQQLQSK